MCEVCTGAGFSPGKTNGIFRWFICSTLSGCDVLQAVNVNKLNIMMLKGILFIKLLCKKK